MYLVSCLPKAIAACVFSQYFFIFFIGLGPQIGGYGGPPWQLGVRA